MKDRFWYLWHPWYWTVGFSVEPGWYIYITLIWLSFGVHLGKATTYERPSQ